MQHFHSQVQQFIVKNGKELGAGSRAFMQAVEKISANLDWMGSNLDSIARWLTTKTNDRF